jgi:hypothetical protein
MAKYVSDLLMDNGLNYWKTNGTEVYLCTSQPADRAAAIATAVVSKTDLISGDYTGPADGTTSGRKLTANAQSGLTASGTGNATHLAWCSGTTLLVVTTVTSQSVTSGNNVSLPAISNEIADVS